MRHAIVSLCVLFVLARPAHAQAPATESVPGSDLSTAIGRLGSLDYATRMNAARTVRRAEGGSAVEALMAAVKASSDQFVRYRALVLLTGFADRRTSEVMRLAAMDRNDRLREVAYRWMAQRPQGTSASELLSALQTESAEFVRPALVRALAAVGSDSRVQRALVAEVSRGQDFFRVGVIDALGEFKADYARDAVVAVAQIDGPLQDDAVLALGRIGDRRSESVLGSLTSSPELAPTIQAAYCLLGSDCATRVRTIADVMVAYGSRPETARAALTGLTILAASGSDDALTVLAEMARSSRVRDLATVGFGGVALRNPDRLLAWLPMVPAGQQTELTEVLRVAFERFEEDFSEEQFFAATRAAYWKAPEGSATRALMASLIQRLEF